MPSSTELGIKLPKPHTCVECGKGFAQKAHLDNHRLLHLRPSIPLYKKGEARLQASDRAETVAKNPNKVVEPAWLDEGKAEAAAREAGGELWRGQLHITWGQYADETFKWLLKNDVGYVVFLLVPYCMDGEQSPLLKWQKQRLLELVRNYQEVSCLLDKRLEQKAERAKKRKEATQLRQDDDEYATDAELLAAAESSLDHSELPVNTQVTTWGQITPAGIQDSDNRPSTSSVSESASDSIQLEGWQEFWDQPLASAQALGMSAPNIKWLKDNETYGLFEPASTYRNAKGETVERKQLKKKMEFHPPPLPTSVKGAVPNMLAFFTTPAFFWRLVGVMPDKIRCPNTNC
ncbi:Hypp3588 [Branchiostoma lanceolatum]|uniref:Hypp3588 protein n=1 Tax=Branchiostoma lanceolatum TaxID=7740 RepID=A0A8K0A0T2_BRALA|nr:Hypp3588 [Branchiostoma lanceolatum]